MKESFEARRLEDLVTFQRGLTYSKSDEVEHSRNIVLRSNNISIISQTLNLNELRYINERINIPDEKKVKKGSLMICTANGSKDHLGKVALIDKNYGYAFGGFMGQLNPRRDIDSKYLYYTLTSESYKKFIRELSDGANINNLKFDDLKKFTLTVPPLPEQHRIVSILDQVFASIDKVKANAKQCLKEIENLFYAYLQEILSNEKWKVVQLGEVCYRVEYGSAAKSKLKGKLPVLRMGNIQDGRFVWDNLVYSDDIEDNKRLLLKYNDVLFNRTNSPELVGKTAIYKGEMPAIFAGYLIRIHRKEDQLDADYLNYYLNSCLARAYSKTVVISSVNQANINGTKLKTYPLPLPTLSEQRGIVKNIDALDAQVKKLKTAYETKINILEELKKSILQKAFSGELKTSELIPA